MQTKWEMREGYSVLPGVGGVYFPDDELGLTAFVAMLAGKAISEHPTLAQAQAALEIAAAKKAGEA